VDNTYGIPEFAVGTGGGEGLYQFGPTAPNLVVRNNVTFGVIKFTLKNGSYDWQFLPAAGQTFTDAGSGNCHGAPASTNFPPVANPAVRIRVRTPSPSTDRGRAIPMGILADLRVGLR